MSNLAWSSQYRCNNISIDMNCGACIYLLVHDNGWSLVGHLGRFPILSKPELAAGLILRESVGSYVGVLGSAWVENGRVAAIGIALARQPGRPRRYVVGRRSSSSSSAVQDTGSWRAPRCAAACLGSKCTVALSHSSPGLSPTDSSTWVRNDSTCPIVHIIR